jgi:heme A synthase
MNLVNLLIWVIVLGLIFYVIHWALSQVPLPAPFNVVARVVLALIVVVVLLGALTGGIHVPVLLK